MPIMYVLKAFHDVQLVWYVVATFSCVDDANLKQDSMWLDNPLQITEVEYRGF
jgi:hypothetical protein